LPTAYRSRGVDLAGDASQGRFGLLFPAGAVAPADLLPHPVRDVADHVRAVGLVVELMAPTGIDASRDAGATLEDRA
jgi:hypothetical protein